MKTLCVLILSIGLFAFSCEDGNLSSQHCISGKIVGQKCDVYAFQLDQPALGATSWQKRTLNGDIVSYDNVIGLLNVPEELRIEDKILFITIRKAMDGENNVPCYHDLPGPPEPLYITLSANDTKCPESEN